MIAESAEISNEFLAQLKEDLVCRRVAHGFARLEELRHLLSSFDPEKKNAALFAGYLAQWVDVGFQRPALVKEIVARFSREVRARLPLHEYLHLRMAQGMVAMAEESTDEAMRHFECVLSLEEETDDQELLSIANFWKGRCLRMKRIRSSFGLCRVLESWLLFQKGNAKEALEI